MTTSAGDRTILVRMALVLPSCAFEATLAVAAKRAHVLFIASDDLRCTL